MALNFFQVKREDKSLDIVVQNIDDGALVIIGNLKELKEDGKSKLYYTHLNDYINAFYQPSFASNIFEKVEEKQTVYLDLEDSIVFGKKGEENICKLRRFV